MPEERLDVQRLTHFGLTVPLPLPLAARHGHRQRQGRRQVDHWSPEVVGSPKLALAALALLQIVPAAEAASKKHHEAGAHSAYAYAPRDEFSPSNYNYAKEAYGWNAGLYPFNFAPDGHRVPLRSNGLCWVPSVWGNPEWGPCS